MDAKPERFYNALQKDYATILKTASETNGEYTLLEVELEPQGGNDLHVHRSFTEEFKVLQGELGVQVGSQRLILKAGESALVPRNVPHCFYNPNGQLTVFQVELRPGHQGFERSLRLFYTTAGIKRGFIEELLLLSLLLELSDSQPTGFEALLLPVFSVLACIAKWRGLDRKLHTLVG